MVDEAPEQNETQASESIVSVSEGRFSVKSSNAVDRLYDTSPAESGDRYTILATAVNFCFLLVALAGGTIVVGRFMLVPIFLILLLMVLAQLLAHFNTTVWNTTTYPLSGYPDIAQLIETLSTEMGIHTPAVSIYEQSNPHAKIIPIIGRSHNRLYLTTGLLEQFNDQELTAIIAHELAHIHHKDHYFRTFSAIIRGTTILAGTGIFFIGFSNLPHFSQSPFEAIIGFPLTITVGFIIFIGGWVSDSQYKQTAEYLADTTAATYTSPKAVYQMLLKLSPSGVDEPVVNAYPLFEDYPPMQRRIQRMRDMKSEDSSTTDKNTS